MARARGRPAGGIPVAPLVLGAGALWLLTRRPAAGALLTGTVPPGRPYLELVFRATPALGASAQAVAEAAADAVAGLELAGSPLFIVTDQAREASSSGGLVQAELYTTVVARVQGFLEGQPWETVLAPLRTRFGSPWTRNLVLVEARQVASARVDLSRQIALAGEGAGGWTVRGWLEDLGDTVKLLGIGVAVVGGVLLLRELRQ